MFVLIDFRENRPIGAPRKSSHRRRVSSSRFYNNSPRTSENFCDLDGKPRRSARPFPVFDKFTIKIIIVIATRMHTQFRPRFFYFDNAVNHVIRFNKQPFYTNTLIFRSIPPSVTAHRSRVYYIRAFSRFPNGFQKYCRKYGGFGKNTNEIRAIEHLVQNSKVISRDTYSVCVLSNETR